MLKYRSAICGLLVVAFAGASIVPGSPATRPSHAKSETDGFVALVPLAHQLHVPVRRGRGAVEIEVDGSRLRVAPGDVTVTEDGVPMMRLSSLPIVHNGQLCIDSRDVSTLLDVDAGTAKANAAHVKRSTAVATTSSFEVRELATPTPRPTAPPTRAFKDPADSTSIPVGKHLVGNVGFELERQATAQYYQLNADGGTKNVHGVLYANGSPGTRPFVSGLVTVGSGVKHAAIGTVTDPLYGNLFAQSGAVGASYENARGTVFTWANSSFADRHSLSLSHTNRGVTDVLALVSGASGPQLLLGRQYTTTSSSGEFDRELWLGTRGAGAALHYQSSGRLYTEARLGFATSGLPLIAGDAPDEANLGYQFTTNFGAKAGFANARGYGSRPFAQLYGRVGAVQLGVARMASESNVTVGVEARAVHVSLDYARAASTSFLNFTGDVALRNGVLEGNAYLTEGNNSDTWLDYRLRRLAPSMTLGLESIRAGGTSRIGPTIGYTAPFAGSMVVGLELHPLMHGQGLRFTLQHQVLALDHAVRPRFITVSLETQTTDPLYAVIDGVREEELTSSAARIAVPDGTHYVSVQSGDGNLASPETRVINGTPETLSMPLWAVLEIHGSLQFANGITPALMGARPSLAGIAVVVQPQGLVGQTDENGNFDIPAQAIAPHSTISVDASTLPDGLAADASQNIPESGSVTIRLKPSKKIQKVIF